METTEGMRERGDDKKEEQKEACCLTNPFCVLEFLGCLRFKIDGRTRLSFCWVSAEVFLLPLTNRRTF